MAKSAAKATIPKPPKSAAETRKIIAALATQHPNADTELHFTNAYQLLVATILSAQCTDERVNQVTPALFKRYPDAAALAKASTARARAADPVDRLLPRQVASRCSGWRLRSSTPWRRHPEDDGRADELPGVGRKTANVVLGHALGVPGLPVDRHVLRVAEPHRHREGGRSRVVEQQLCAALPKANWTRHLRHAHPPRPPHLQTEAALPPMRRARGLPLLPQGRVEVRSEADRQTSAKSKCTSTREASPGWSKKR